MYIYARTVPLYKKKDPSHEKLGSSECFRAAG
jgi:hypothetical protein